jgi:hypothetical protein
MQIEPIFPQAVLGIIKLEADSNKILKHIENIEFEITRASDEKEANAYISKNFKFFVINKIKCEKNNLIYIIK